MSKISFQPPHDFQVAVGIGLFKNMEYKSIFGRSGQLVQDIETDVTGLAEPVYIFPSNDGEAMEIVSDNVADVGQEYEIEGLGLNFESISEVVALNGTTAATLANTYTRINNIGNVDETPSAGLVVVRGVSNQQVYSQATAQAQESNQAVYSVPADYRSEILTISGSLQKAGGVDDDVTIGVKYRVPRKGSAAPSGVFRAPFNTNLERSGSSSNEYNNRAPRFLDGPVDYKFYGTSRVGGSVVSVRAALLLVKNSSIS